VGVNHVVLSVQIVADRFLRLRGFHRGDVSELLLDRARLLLTDLRGLVELRAGSQ
jgi:hypothetical protein